MKKLKVGLFNDSFPPQVDGVVMSVLSYARVITRDHGEVVVAAPKYPKYKDNFPYKVVRYPSSPGGERIGYRIGNPFSIASVRKLVSERLDIIHAHCPFSAMVLARFVRRHAKIPVVFTYHTKFDIDIEKRVGLSGLRTVSTKFILNNIAAADEVWAVSKGAGENLRSIGYKGNYRVMENGTDFDRRRASAVAVNNLKATLGIRDEICFLFVGRMMWYKGIRFTLDALKVLHDRGIPFKMVFVGDGFDMPDIQKYVADLGMTEKCVFAGVIKDREILREYYSMADLFLFPSTYDTNGLVVREASACDLGSVVIRGSCAAESVPDERSAILIDENVESYVAALTQAYENRSGLSELGRMAGENIYLSWDEAIGRAVARYREIIGSYR